MPMAYFAVSCPPDPPDPAESDPNEGMDDTPAREQENLPEED
jgi:hypothetical protein